MDKRREGGSNRPDPKLLIEIYLFLTCKCTKSFSVILAGLDCANLHSINVQGVNTRSDVPCPVGSSAAKIQIQKLAAW